MSVNVQKKDNFVRRMARSINVSVDKYLPDAFIFAICLSAVVFVLGLIFAKQTPFQMVKHWYDGFGDS